MKKATALMGLLLSCIAVPALLVSCADQGKNVGQTTITKWKDNKKSAVSITYDDGIITQLTVARPIMDSIGLPATFFVITGKMEGSGKGKFIGRPKEEIIKETATIPTNKDNFFERASLIGFTGTTQGLDYHYNVGSMFEAGKVDEAYALLDEAYAKLRKGQLKNTDDVVFHNNPVDTTSWKQYQEYAAKGHEIASHTVTHPRLAVLDEPNLKYELEQSKADMEKFMGEKYAFSAECPFGTENERVMEYAHKVYPALRNRMPAPYLQELNRGSKDDPTQFNKEYVQWQRGALSTSSMETLDGWVDTSLTRDNIWLVLVIHGVENYGWEPLTKETLKNYFGYIKSKEDSLWVGTFGDVTKYIRERMGTTVSGKKDGSSITVSIASEVDPEVYDVPLTLKTYVPNSWKSAQLDGKSLDIQQDGDGSYVIYSVAPGTATVTLNH